jgi:hypothetical protein
LLIYVESFFAELQSPLECPYKATFDLFLVDPPPTLKKLGEGQAGHLPLQHGEEEKDSHLFQLFPLPHAEERASWPYLLLEGVTRTMIKDVSHSKSG